MPWFDFSGKELRVAEVLPLVRFIIEQIPDAYVCYHHGELCQIPLHERVADARELVPWIRRMGHAICLGVALQGRNTNAALASKADACLAEMSSRRVAIEVAPSCNLGLGGATSLSYVHDFLAAGVDIHVGTDDPGFLGTDFATERALLVGAAGAPRL